MRYPSPSKAFALAVMNALSRTFSLAALLVAAFGLSSCYTQLGATEPARSDRYRTAAPAAEATPTAPVGLRYETDEPVYEEEYYEEGTYGDDVQVTRYRYDDDVYDRRDYYGGSYGGYYSYDPYYDYAPYYYSSRWRWHHLYSPYYPAPAWAYAYDPFFDLRWRRGWGWSVSISFGSPYYHRPYYSPYYYDPFFSPYYYGYSPHYAGYARGYHRGYYDGYYYGGGRSYAGGSYGTIRGRSPRGSIRSALDAGGTRRRALMAYADSRNDGGALLDSPLGVRSVRALANDSRQHVLAGNESVRSALRTGATARTGRVTDRAAPAPSGRLATPRATTDDDRAPAVRMPSARSTGQAAPALTREPADRSATTRQPATRPERRLGRPSRWDDAQPDRSAAPAPRTTTRSPATRSGERSEPTPPRRRVYRPLPPPTRQEPTRPAPRTTREPETRPAPPSRSAPQTRPAPPARTERPAPRRETTPSRPAPQSRPAPPKRESAPARSSPPPSRSAPSRSGSSDDRSGGRTSRRSGRGG